MKSVLGNEYSYVQSYNSSHIYHNQSPAEWYMAYPCISILWKKNVKIETYDFIYVEDVLAL